MPELEGCEYLLDYLFRIRPGVANGMAYTSLPWQEIESWARLVKIPLSGWEAETLAKMSDAYCGQLAASSKKDCPPPWAIITEKSIENNREKVANGLLELLRGNSKKPAMKPAKKRPQ